MLDAKMHSAGLGQQVGAPAETAHALLSRCSGGKGLSGIIPTSRTPQPQHLHDASKMTEPGRSLRAAGDWKTPLPLLMLRPPSKALVAESPKAHMFDLELESMLEAALRNVFRRAGLQTTEGIPLYHFAYHIEQARGVSSYVAMCGSSSVTETRTTTGFKFMGIGKKKTTVSPCTRARTTARTQARLPLISSVFPSGRSTGRLRRKQARESDRMSCTQKSLARRVCCSSQSAASW